MGVYVKNTCGRITVNLNQHKAAGINQFANKHSICLMEDKSNSSAMPKPLLSLAQTMENWHIHLLQLLPHSGLRGKLHA